jgi:hypothetical protein
MSILMFRHTEFPRDMEVLQHEQGPDELCGIATSNAYAFRYTRISESLHASTGSLDTNSGDSRLSLPVGPSANIAVSKFDLSMIASKLCSSFLGFRNLYHHFTHILAFEKTKKS